MQALAAILAKDYRDFDGKPCSLCGEQQFGGSHYHCENCGNTSTMYGHYDLNSDKFSCKKRK